ncbi:MAG: tRNA (adenosine(37)-N6)-threonylcarbamoyltransferase complex transferase subunit TsaD [Spirochaetales bacterium]|nr:tRNA (adenosine(37)-N6)-threonylcarbamoyltransferase complex transferase subunit TsaD [Spirochaetales bacterium]
MKILGIETSCDECAAAVVENGGRVLGNVVASQIEEHRPYYGVVPEIASRKHLEWIVPVVKECLGQAGIAVAECDAVAATYRPGLIGSLLVGLSFGKGLAACLGKPFIGVDHVEAHLYAPRLEREIPYPYIGVLVSGGHTMISIVRGEDDLEVLGTTIDDACGECFDKVAKHYDFGYPGGAAVDRLAQKGDPHAFHFPKPSLHKGEHTYDVSYSGLKNAVCNQLEQFRNPKFPKTPENIAAGFQKTAIAILLDRVLLAVRNYGVYRVVVGGGVAANSSLRERLAGEPGLEAIFPPLKYCTDNAAMVAGLAFHKLKKNGPSSFDLPASARVRAFRRI